MSTANIVIVDDTIVNLDVLEEILSNKGYEVRPFPKGSLALASAKNDPPDIFLLDIMMPEMDGYEVCRNIKEDPQLTNIPVIFISAKTDALDKIKAFGSGGVDYITKPFHAEEVFARVGTHLDLALARKELEENNRKLRSTLSELKATQSQLIQSEKMASIGVLAAGIAHEINNPINFINISSKGLKKKIQPIIDFLGELPAPEKIETDPGGLTKKIEELELSSRLEAIDELMTNISTGAARTVQIVDGLRSFSRMDQTEKELTDIHKGIESTLIILRNQAKDIVRFEKDFGDIPKIMAFPGKLYQAFMNITKNAVDAVKSKPNLEEKEIISICTSNSVVDNKPAVTIEISDTGSGIPEEIRDKIYDPFFTTKEIGSGTGLGLSITLGIVESHGGKLEMETEMGRGTCFKLHLPVN